jgi:branched-chain amino acid transport system permease protein
MEAASIPESRRRTAGAPRSPSTFIGSATTSSGCCSAVALLYFFVQDPKQTLDDVKTGLSNGTIWALIALGYTLVYGIIELINFAHGEVFMIGSFVSVSIWQTLGVTAATAPIPGDHRGDHHRCSPSRCSRSGTLNVMIERVAYRPLRNAPKLAPLITAIGMSFILQNVGLLWRPTPDAAPDLIGSQKDYFTIFGVDDRALGRLRGRSSPCRCSSRCSGSSARRATARRCARPRRTPTPRA